MIDLILQSLLSRKTRTFLNVLGIIIGIASIATLLLLSAGLTNAVVEQFSAIGNNVIFVFPQSFGNNPNAASGLEGSDISLIRGIAGIDETFGYYSNTLRSEHSKEEKLAVFWGIEPDKFEELLDNFDLSIAEGRVFDKQGGRRIVMGSAYAEDLFEKELRVGSTVFLEGEKFKVIGILDSVGNPEDDNKAYVPIQTLWRLRDVNDEYTFLEVRVNNADDAPSIASLIKKKIEDKKGPDRVQVQTAEQLLDQAQSILGILQISLVSIAFISLIVGGVGIANSFYTSVIERTKEIGIMKAIGAKNQQITNLFLYEAGIVGLIGSAVGLLIGFAIAKAVEYGSKLTGYDLLIIELTPNIMLICIGTGVLATTFAGYFPARSAANLKPVDALRK